MPGKGKPFKAGNKGRPPGSPNKLTRKLHERLAGSKDDPVQALIECVQHGREQGDWELVQKAASNLAPYVHPRLRLSTIEMDFQQMPDIVVNMVKPDMGDD